MSQILGTMHPTQWAILSGIEHELQLPTGRTNDYTNYFGTDNISNNNNWILSNTNLDKIRSSTLRSKFFNFTNSNNNGIHNDENNGLVFGCQYYDAKQYEWV